VRSLDYDRERLQTENGCLVALPSHVTGRLPVIYLLHGQFDTEVDWWSSKGQLAAILAGASVAPMLIVMPFCLGEKVCQSS
jgi:hypothetical protein